MFEQPIIHKKELDEDTGTTARLSLMSLAHGW
jgi:hypothetical protein